MTGFSHNVTAALAFAAVATKLPEALLRALCWVESSGNPMAVGPKLRNGQTAKGLLQLLDATAHTYGAADSFDPKQNALAGARYLRWLSDKFGGVDHALAAYNWGPGHVQEALRDGSKFPAQVQRYVNRVKDRWAIEDQGAIAAACTGACPVHCGGHS